MATGFACCKLLQPCSENYYFIAFSKLLIINVSGHLQHRLLQLHNMHPREKMNEFTHFGTETESVKLSEPKSSQHSVLYSTQYL